MKPKIIGVTGWKNAGKTTLVERLVSELTRRGFRVSTVKHAHHDADVDHEGTDSFRHRQAGAGEVALVSSRRWALMHELRGEAEPALDDVLARLSPCDLVLVEGFKREAHPKIEVRRREARDTRPLAEAANVVAIAADRLSTGEALPAFQLDDIRALADFVQEFLKLQSDPELR